MEDTRYWRWELEPRFKGPITFAEFAGVGAKFSDFNQMGLTAEQFNTNAKMYLMR